jgi:glycyl-tRNA synthetase
MAADVYRSLKKRWNVFYDEKGSIGKRYRRQDESGTPFCITVDHQSMEDQTVTLRDRDTTTQERVKIVELESLIAERLRAA